MAAVDKENTNLLGSMTYYQDSLKSGEEEKEGAKWIHFLFHF